MHELLELLLASVAGAILGAIFFGGLWWTVRECVVGQRSTLWLLGSWLVRMGIAVTGFYLVGHMHWLRLLAALFGFIVARLLVIRLIRWPDDLQANGSGDRQHETGHAS
jgi:F1F0 ATPase subunit 2